ncbi:MAG: hypothetical protein H6623_02760 [Bdellovibrionaceae bacterium]|nr:hypothetical protein [Pseudobdellovibrionaceae bacterium]
MIQTTFIALTFLLSGFFTHADETVVKSCSAQLKQGPESVDILIEIISQDGKLNAKITQNSQSYNQTVEVGDLSVRENLTTQTENDDLNLAEQLIVHAMLLSSEPTFQGQFTTGIDLSQVRSAKVYTIGPPTNMGTTALIEAKDASGKTLGTFLGGFLISPCK